MTFIIFNKDGTRTSYSNGYDEEIESEADAGWDDAYAQFPDAKYIEHF